MNPTLFHHLEKSDGYLSPASGKITILTLNQMILGWKNWLFFCFFTVILAVLEGASTKRSPTPCGSGSSWAGTAFRVNIRVMHAIKTHPKLSGIREQHAVLLFLYLVLLRWIIFRQLNLPSHWLKLKIWIIFRQLNLPSHRLKLKISFLLTSMNFRDN